MQYLGMGDIHLNNLSNIIKSAAMLGFIILGFPALLYAETANEQPPGAVDYINNCAVCHGVDGRGGGPMAKQLMKQPKDLTLLSRENSGSFPETVVYQIIDGRRVNIFHGSQEMPIWGERFFATEGNEDMVNEKISKIIRYIESIQIE